MKKLPKEEPITEEVVEPIKKRNKGKSGSGLRICCSF